MSIRLSVHASLFVVLLAPGLASADGGVVRFAGAVVEPASCRPRVTQATPVALPRVACSPASRAGTFDPGLRAKTDVRELPADRGAAPGASSRRYVVTLEYL